jgi:SSS family solute:Na+ symporter/sodium/proline symporter
MSWMIVTVLGAVGTGLAGAAYVAANEGQVAEYLAGKGGLGAFDPETIFIVLSQILFHPYVAGFLLAAILAAIMSTISSQLLVSSSSLTEDFYRIFLRKGASERELVTVGRACVLLVSLIAIGLAYDPGSNILTLVSNAWFGFGSAFGPVILLSLYWRRMTRTGALASMVTGAVVVLFWVYGPVTVDGAPLSAVLAAIIPGFAAATIAAVVGSLATKEASDAIRQRHDEVVATVRADGRIAEANAEGIRAPATA